LHLPLQPAAEYTFDAFTQMLDDQQVEVLVVTTVDATHDQYIIPALKRGIRVLTEKPMTTDIEKSKAILRAVKETNNHLTVTFVSTRLRLRGLFFFS
jgi:predicted dehydrogenase